MPTQRSLRIVIAEDEFLLAEDLRQLVEASGHEVVGVVATAPELVSLVEDWRPDLALVDVQLARGSNGLDAAMVRGTGNSKTAAASESSTTRFCRYRKRQIKISRCEIFSAIYM